MRVQPGRIDPDATFMRIQEMRSSVRDYVVAALILALPIGVLTNGIFHLLINWRLPDSGMEWCVILSSLALCIFLGLYLVHLASSQEQLARHELDVVIPVLVSPDGSATFPEMHCAGSITSPLQTMHEMARAVVGAQGVRNDVRADVETIREATGDGFAAIEERMRLTLETLAATGTSVDNPSVRPLLTELVPPLLQGIVYSVVASFARDTLDRHGEYSRYFLMHAALADGAQTVTLDDARRESGNPWLCDAARLVRDFRTPKGVTVTFHDVTAQLQPADAPQTPRIADILTLKSEDAQLGVRVKRLVTFYGEKKKTHGSLWQMLKTKPGPEDRLVIIRCFLSVELRLTIRRRTEREQEVTLRTLEWWQKLAEQLIDELDKERIIQRGLDHGKLQRP